jgi:hypothetical protein
MNPAQGPRAGTRPYLALAQLHKDGGQTTFIDWMRSTAWPGSIVQFDRVIILALIGAQLVFLRDDLYVLADRGLEHLGIVPDVPVAPPVVVPARTAVGMRPLSSMNRPRVGIIREGAFDYRNIPSLQGSQRTPFESAMRAARGDAN